MIYVLLKKRYFNNVFQLSTVVSILFLIFFSLMILFEPIESYVEIGGGYRGYFVSSLSNSNSVLFTSLIHGFERYFFGQDRQRYTETGRLHQAGDAPSRGSLREASRDHISRG